MRLAIDSVGHALQGMLYSLNEMAQDSAEGHKIVRGANNAASFTAEAARELVDSAREMSRVVGRVTQLALRTRQVAGQIDAEAVHTGRTGEVFTSVVAGEVKGLAQKTSQATIEIEQTIAEILATARRYEEAIGQIIKNIAAINKVSQNLGELMLSPPPQVEPGTPLSAPQAPALTPAPAAAVAVPRPTLVRPAEPIQAPPPEAPDPFAAAEDPAEDPTPEPQVEIKAKPAKAGPTKAFSLDDDPAEEELSLEEVAAETQTVIEEFAVNPEPEPGNKPTGSNANVFLLGRNKPAPPKAEPKVAEAAAPDPQPAAAQADQAQPAPAPAANPPAGGTSPNVIMLNKPKKPAAAEPKAPAAAPAAPAPTPAGGDEESITNVFMLNMPKEADPAPEPPAEEPAGAGAGRPNVFMLNKPK